MGWRSVGWGWRRRRRDYAHLLHEAQQVEVDPALGYFAVLHSEEAGAGPVHFLVGGRNTHEVARMRAFDHAASHHQVALGNQVFKGEPDVGHGVGELAVSIFQARNARLLAGDRVVVYEFGIYEFVKRIVI